MCKLRLHERLAGAAPHLPPPPRAPQQVGPIAATGVSYISVGSLTHSVKALDISLKIQLAPSSTS